MLKKYAETAITTLELRLSCKVFFLSVYYKICTMKIFLIMDATTQ